MAPFVEAPHLLQNMGEGTFHHSGSLAMRASVAANANITYKLLYNSAVAMTGGQQAAGLRSIAEITHMLTAEGVKRIIITAEDPGRYRGVRVAHGTDVWSRDRLEEAQRTLAAVSGVTVLIHDQQCATEKRRQRKRNPSTEAETRVVINERDLRGVRRLRREVQLLVSGARGDRLRAQDAHPPGILQHGSDMPDRRLSRVRDSRGRRRCPRGTGPPPRRPRRSAPGPRPHRRRQRTGGPLHRNRRHRRRHRRPDPRPGGARRGVARTRPGPDRPLAEGRPGDLRPDPIPYRDGARQQAGRRRVRRLHRLRPAGRRGTAKPLGRRPAADRRRAVTEPGPRRARWSPIHT